MLCVGLVGNRKYMMYVGGLSEPQCLVCRIPVESRIGWCLSINCESRNTKLNVRCFGDYIHLEEDKQQASKPCRTPRSYIS
jgi:hypothetical protein